MATRSEHARNMQIVRDLWRSSISRKIPNRMSIKQMALAVLKVHGIAVEPGMTKKKVVARCAQLSKHGATDQSRDIAENSRVDGEVGTQTIEPRRQFWMDRAYRATLQE